MARLLITPAAGGTITPTQINIGTLTYSDTGILISAQSSTNSYNQIIIQNSNNGATASSDFVVNNDQSTATTNYGDYGMNSSGFAGSGSFNQPGYVYLTSTTVDLAIGTTTSNAIHFVVNNGATDAATISTAGLLTLNNGLTAGGGAISLSPASFNVTLSPTGTGTVTINPATASAINNCSIGQTTALAGSFTTLSASSTVSGTGFSTYLASPPAIGGTSAAAGSFTNNTATTQFLGPNGAVGTPSYSWTNETNTGRYRHGAGVISESVGGADVFAFAANLIALPSATVLGFTASTPYISADTVITRQGVGLLGVGTSSGAPFAGSLKLTGLTINQAGPLISSSVSLTNNAASNVATLTNSPTTGNPTKWFPINDNGTTRNIPAW